MGIFCQSLSSQSCDACLLDSQFQTARSCLAKILPRTKLLKLPIASNSLISHHRTHSTSLITSRSNYSCNFLTIYGICNNAQLYQVIHENNEICGVWWIFKMFTPNFIPGRPKTNTYSQPHGWDLVMVPHNFSLEIVQETIEKLLIMHLRKCSTPQENTLLERTRTRTPDG